MSDKMRWRWGDTNSVLAAIDAETVIEIGDLLFQEKDDARPAHKAKDQLDFVEKFLGVAMQRSREGDTAPIRVATSGIFEFDCVGDVACELGDMVYPTGRQAVLPVDARRFAIGRVAQRQPKGTTIHVAIHSTIMSGGIR